MGRKLFLVLNLVILVLGAISIWYIENGWTFKMNEPIPHLVILIGGILIIPIFLTTLIHYVFAPKFSSSAIDKVKYFTSAVILYALVSVPYAFTFVFSIIWTVAGLSLSEYLTYAIPLSISLALYIGTYVVISAEYLGKIEV